MKISKKNEVHLILEDLEPHETAELSSFFTFEVPGFKFMPAYRSRQWDGKIRLFSPASGEIYVGLLPYIKEFCARNEIKYTIEKGVEDVRNVIRQTVRDFTKSFKPKSKGKILNVRDYQIDAIQHAISTHRSLLVSPTASGKSLIIYFLVRYYRMAGQKILILVPTTSLVEQMYSDFKDYGWDSDTHCQKIYQGYDKNITKGVVISTWQSIYKMPKSYFENFGCVFGDEAHLFKAKSLTGIMTKLHQCKYRFGFTGTLDDTQVHHLVLEGLFGPVKKVITTKELMDKKTLANLKIKCIVLKHPLIKEKMTYVEELQYIVGNEQRNNFIVNLLTHLSGNTLCLFQLVEKHGQILYDKVKEKHNANTFFVYGGTNTKEREEIRAIVDANKIEKIIVLSFGKNKTSIQEDVNVLLSNGSIKKAKQITKDDDVDNNWINIHGDQ